MHISTLSRRPLPSTPDSPGVSLSGTNSSTNSPTLSSGSALGSAFPTPVDANGSLLGGRGVTGPDVRSGVKGAAAATVNSHGDTQHSVSSSELLSTTAASAVPRSDGLPRADDRVAIKSSKPASPASSSVALDPNAAPSSGAAADSEQQDPPTHTPPSGEVANASPLAGPASSPAQAPWAAPQATSGFFSVGSRIARVMVQPINLMVNLASPSNISTAASSSTSPAGPVPQVSTMIGAAVASLPTPTDSRQPSQAVSPDLAPNEMVPHSSSGQPEQPQAMNTGTSTGAQQAESPALPIIQTSAPASSDHDVRDFADTRDLSPRPRSISAAAAAANAASSEPTRRAESRPRSSTMAAPGTSRTNNASGLSPFPTLHESASTPVPNSAPAGPIPPGFAGPPEIPLVAKHSKNHAFHAIFKHLPLDEFLIEDFSCALQKEILVQGRLYLTERHICFHAVIFGWVTSVQIPLAEVTLIEKRVTALIFPNAIEVHTHTQRYFFASFIFRELAFNLMCSLWHKARGDAGFDCLPFHPDRPLGTVEGAAAAAESKKVKGRRPRSQSRKRLFTFGSSSSRNGSASSSSTGPMDGLGGGKGKAALGGSKLGLGSMGESTSNTDSASDAGQSSHGLARRRTGASGRQAVLAGAGCDDGDESDDEGDRSAEPGQAGDDDDDEDSGWDLRDEDDNDEDDGSSAAARLQRRLAPVKRTKSSTSSPAKSPRKPRHKAVTQISNEETPAVLGLTPMEGTHPRSLSDSSIHAPVAGAVAAQSLRNAASSDLLPSPRLPPTSIPLPPSRSSTPASATVPAAIPDNVPAASVELPPVGACSCEHHTEVVLDTDWPNVLPVQCFQFLYSAGAPIVDLVIKSKMNCTDLDFAAWTPAPSTPPLPPASATRALTYNMPLNLPVPVPGAPKVTGVKSRESMVDSSPSHFALAAVTETPDVPSGTSFAIHAHVCMTHTGQGVTHVKVSVAVKWSKSVWMLKSTIENGAVDGQKKYWMQVDEAIRAQFGKPSEGDSAGASPAKATPTRRRTRSGSGAPVSKSSGPSKLSRVSGKGDLATADASGLPAPTRRGSGHHRPSGKRTSKSGGVKGRDTRAPSDPRSAATSRADKLHLGLLVALVLLNVVVFWQLRAMHGSVSRAHQQASLEVTWTAATVSTSPPNPSSPSAIDAAPLSVTSTAPSPTGAFLLSTAAVGVATVQTGAPPAVVPSPSVSKVDPLKTEQHTVFADRTEL